MSQNTFHLGLCMAGSISAGAYTAGVIDYLQEALENWEKAKRSDDQRLPTHKVIIDMLGGASGGGITAALAYFALRSNVDHGQLEPDGKTYTINPDSNIYWKTWVELTENDIFGELLKEDDIKEGYIPSLLNASFVDEVGEIFRTAITAAGVEPISSAYIHEKAELFLTLFNVTGIKYEINSKSPSAKTQYLSEHRDVAHFQWGDEYSGDGRMEVSFRQDKNIETLLAAAKATGAFPAGLCAREIRREAKYIWDNPFFRKNKFEKENINLGDAVKEDTDIYTTINGDGGTANNEPVEFCRDLMLDIRINDYRDINPMVSDSPTETQQVMKRKSLTNSSVILIDPFPSYDFEIKKPSRKSYHLLNYLPEFVFALASQLIFDAKDAFDAYDKDNYGLHIVAPSKDELLKPQYAIACGSLGGFGGFLSKEFRIHDFFLGRHNCQSFLRKFFVVDLDEVPGTEEYGCVEAVIKGYKDKPEAVKRFSYEDERGRRYVPIIPDLTLEENIIVKEFEEADGTKKIKYLDKNPLPLYKIQHLERIFFEEHREQLKTRIRKILNSLFDAKLVIDLTINLVAKSVDDVIADRVIDYIIADFEKRELIKS